MFRKKTNAAKATEQPAIATRKVTDERDVLRARDAEVRKAEQAVSEIAANVARLERIISDAEAADKALQARVAEDGAVSLSAFAQGEAAPDSDIGTLLANAENTARAAVAAKVALPRVQAQLANARAQLEHLRQLHSGAARDFMLMLANEAGRKYMTAYKQLTAAYDELRGISNALPPVSPTEPDIKMSSQPIQVPSFNLPSVRGGSSEWIETKTYHGNEAAIGAEAAKWSEAFQRVTNNTEADVDDLIQVAP